MKSVARFCAFLSLWGISACKTTQASHPDAVTDFGENVNAPGPFDLTFGDHESFSRNSWWLKNPDYDMALFKEFGGPNQVIDGETEDQIAKRASKAANQGQASLNGGKRLRAFHAKSQACLNGKLTVLDSVLANEELAFGIFKPVDGVAPSYQIVGRFSNGNGKSQSDAASDPRGFAIKVLNVKGQRVVPDMPEPTAVRGEGSMHQDFLGTNSPVFPTRNAKSYVDFHEKTLESETSSTAMPRYLLSPFTKDGARTAHILKKFIDDSIGSLAEITYGSGGAFKMGDRAGKYWLRGCAEEKDSDGRLYPATKKPSEPSADYLEKELEDRMAARGEVCMEILVQIQRHPIFHPIEDPSVIWKDIGPEASDSELESYHAGAGVKVPANMRSASFQPIARMSFPVADNKGFRSAESKQACEGMFFNTWHTTADHKPIGNMNRVRLQVYRESWNFRQPR